MDYAIPCIQDSRRNVSQYHFAELFGYHCLDIQLDSLELELELGETKIIMFIFTP